MWSSRHRLPVVLMSLLLWGQPWAPVVEASFIWYGYGAASCTKFLAHVDTQRDSYGQWLAGFFSGLNFSLSDTDDIAGEWKDAITPSLEWIMAYCHRNARKTVADAVTVLVKELYPLRQKPAPSERRPPTPKPRTR